MFVAFASAEQLIFEVKRHAICRYVLSCLQHLCKSFAVGCAEKYLSEGLGFIRTKLNACHLEVFLLSAGGIRAFCSEDLLFFSNHQTTR